MCVASNEMGVKRKRCSSNLNASASSVTSATSRAASAAWAWTTRTINTFFVEDCARPSVGTLVLWLDVDNIFISTKVLQTAISSLAASSSFGLGLVATMAKFHPVPSLGRTRITFYQY